VIAAFSRTNPDVDVIIQDLGWKGVLAAVRAGEASLGIGAWETTEAELVSTPLMDDQLHVVTPIDHPLARLDEIHLKDIARHQLVLTNASSSVRNTIEYQFQKLGLLLLVKHDVAQFSSAIGLVRAKMGITVLPSLASELRDCGGLFTRQISGCTRKIVLLTSARRTRSEAAEKFAELLSHAFHQIRAGLH
jgi:DNA-binding transcriptional LysR family regulator